MSPHTNIQTVPMFPLVTAAHPVLDSSSIYSDDELNWFFLLIKYLVQQWKEDQGEYASLRPVETEENQVLKNENKNSQVFHLAHFTSNN